jgi:hypothetical protein
MPTRGLVGAARPRNGGVGLIELESGSHPVESLLS